MLHQLSCSGCKNVKSKVEHLKGDIKDLREELKDIKDLVINEFKKLKDEIAQQ